jgi:hypothetical protein
VPRVNGWHADTLFDMVEILHDLVSKPTKGYLHSYYDCGYHATQFDRPAGQREYRDQIDDVLRFHDPPYEFGDNGRLIQRLPDDFRPLLDAELPDDVDGDLVAAKVEHARRLFLARASSPEDRRHAVRELADALVALRPDVKAAMLSKDESALFNLLTASRSEDGRVGGRRRGRADWPTGLVSSHPPSNRACGSPAHGSPTFFTVGIRLPSALTGGSWRGDRSVEADQAVAVGAAVEDLPAVTPGLLMAFGDQHLQASFRVAVDLVELDGRVAVAEVARPSRLPESSWNFDGDSTGIVMVRQ